MRDFKDKKLTDRLQNANKAKQALIEKMRAAPRPDDPDVVAQRAAKSAVLSANRVERERRQAEKIEVARAKAEHEAAEKAAKLAEAERKKREDADKMVALLAEQKAARDARYAARKKGNG